MFYLRPYHQEFLIVLVDDFVGTGETALGAVNYVRELCPFMEDNKQIKVLCIVACRMEFRKWQQMALICFAGI